MSVPSLSSRPPIPADWAFAFGTALYVILVAMLARVGVVGVELAFHRSAPETLWLVTSPWGVLTSLLAVEGMLFALALSRLRAHPPLAKRIRSELRFDGWSTLLGAVMIVGIGPSTNAFAFTVARWAHIDVGSLEAMSLLVKRASSVEFVLLLLGLALIPGIVEELLFRGLVQGALSDARPFVAGILQAIVFGVFHADITQGLATVLLGLGFGFVRYQSRNLTAAMVAHAAYNASVVLSLRFVQTTVNSSVSPAPSTIPVFEIVGGLAVAIPAAFYLWRRAHARCQSD
jgi:membrane protease YdiL (CAAX protease family)